MFRLGPGRISIKTPSKPKVHKTFVHQLGWGSTNPTCISLSCFLAVRTLYPQASQGTIHIGIAAQGKKGIQPLRNTVFPTQNDPLCLLWGWGCTVFSRHAAPQQGRKHLPRSFSGQENGMGKDEDPAPPVLWSQFESGPEVLGDTSCPQPDGSCWECRSAQQKPDLTLV